MTNLMQIKEVVINVPDENEYPTEEELQQILDWDWNDAIGLVRFIESIWWNADVGAKITGKRVINLELHTGGWSGNEDVIRVLRENMFWNLYWQKSIRGGHYYFKFKIKGSD